MAKNALRNARQLNKAVEKFIERSKGDIVTHLESVGFTFFNYLQTYTPRDSGRAAGGWIPVVDTSPSDWKPAKGRKFYSDRKFDLYGKIKFNSVIFISNNVEYIVPLNEGHSMRAPSGFEAPAITATTAFYEGKLARLNRKRYNV